MPAVSDLAHPKVPHRQGCRRERLHVPRLPRQLSAQNQPRNDHERSADPEQPRDHAGHESEQRHQHPRHGSPPRSGSPPAPQPPPPGVSIRTTSPGSSSALTLGASAAPFKTVRPGAPEPPPAAPPGAWRRRSARTLSSIGANASNSRTTPSPPPPPPPPPPAPPQPRRLTPP